MLAAAAAVAMLRAAPSAMSSPEKGSTGVELASPAAAVKAGRARGAPVLERRKKEEAALEEANKAKTTRRSSPSRARRQVAFVLNDSSLSNGVGIRGRGRAAVNAPLSNDGSSLEAQQKRRSSLLAKAEFRPMSTVLAVAPAGKAHAMTCPW